mgnify:CR=1 FL=1
METLRLQKKEKNIHLMLKTNILIESIDMSTITKPKSIISKPKQKTQSWWVNVYKIVAKDIDKDIMAIWWVKKCTIVGQYH